LSPQEIESLRQDLREAREEIQAIYARMKAEGHPAFVNLSAA
jgi:hypothetical protein